MGDQNWRGGEAQVSAVITTLKYHKNGQLICLHIAIMTAGWREKTSRPQTTALCHSRELNGCRHHQVCHAQETKLHSPADLSRETVRAMKSTSCVVMTCYSRRADAALPGGRQLGTRGECHCVIRRGRRVMAGSQASPVFEWTIGKVLRDNAGGPVTEDGG